MGRRSDYSPRSGIETLLIAYLFQTNPQHTKIMRIADVASEFMRVCFVCRDVGEQQARDRKAGTPVTTASTPATNGRAILTGYSRWPAGHDRIRNGPG
jgi:hypothetical protein